MKKILLLLSVVMLLAACNTESTADALVADTTPETSQDLAYDTEPSIADSSEEGEIDTCADIYLEEPAEESVLDSPLNLTISVDNGEIASAGNCTACGYEWSYIDGEDTISVCTDCEAPSALLNVSSILSFDYSDTQGVVNVQLADNAEITGVSRWTADDDSYNASYEGTEITLENDGERYIYVITVNYPQESFPNGYGIVNYCFIIE